MRISELSFQSEYKALDYLRENNFRKTPTGFWVSADMSKKASFAITHTPWVYLMFETS